MLIVYADSLTVVQGVTLLALGNGAPDIFSAFAAINQSDDRKSSLAIGALFGQYNSYILKQPMALFFIYKVLFL